jgi:uncharacterized protein YqeY
MSSDPVQDLAGTVRADMREALRRRDRAAAPPLREILALIDQAGAVEAPQGYDYTGVAPTEVPRLEVTMAEVTAGLQRLVDERQAAAATYRDLDQPDRAAEHARAAAVIASYLPPTAASS